MTGYQKLKTENKELWNYIEELQFSIKAKEYPNNIPRAKTETKKIMAWLKVLIEEKQHETK